MYISSEFRNHGFLSRRRAIIILSESDSMNAGRFVGPARIEGRV